MVLYVPVNFFDTSQVSTFFYNLIIIWLIYYNLIPDALVINLAFKQTFN